MCRAFGVLITVRVMIAKGMKDNKVLTYAIVVVAIVLWGMSYIWSDTLIRLGVSVYYFLPIRILLAGLALLVFNWLSGALVKIRREDLWKFLIVALCEPLLYFLFETIGIRETGSPTISSVIIATVPIFSITAGVLFFREKISLVNIVGVAVTLAGIFVVVSGQDVVSCSGNFVLGVILLLLAVLTEVGYASFTKVLTSKYDASVIAMYQFLIGSVYFLPFFFTKGLEDFSPVYLSWAAIKPILYLAVLCSSLAFTLWAMSIDKLGVGKSSVFIAMMCVSTALVAEVIGRESLSLWQWLGVALAIAGIILSQRAKRNSGVRIDNSSVVNGHATV